jgi:hypothetical protein
MITHHQHRKKNIKMGESSAPATHLCLVCLEIMERIPARAQQHGEHDVQAMYPKNHGNHPHVMMLVTRRSSKRIETVVVSSSAIRDASIARSKSPGPAVSVQGMIASNAFQKLSNKVLQTVNGKTPYVYKKKKPLTLILFKAIFTHLWAGALYQLLVACSINLVELALYVNQIIPDT